LPTFTQSKIRELQASGEKPNLDYKLRYDLKIDDVKNELAKDASAIANFLYQTSGQGYLIIGINDDGIIVGVNPRDYKEERIQQIISGRTDPPPIFTVHQVAYSGVNLASKPTNITLLAICAFFQLRLSLSAILGLQLGFLLRHQLPHLLLLQDSSSIQFAF